METIHLLEATIDFLIQSFVIVDFLDFLLGRLSQIFQHLQIFHTFGTVSTVCSAIFIVPADLCFEEGTELIEEMEAVGVLFQPVLELVDILVGQVAELMDLFAVQSVEQPQQLGILLIAVHRIRLQASLGSLHPVKLALHGLEIVNLAFVLLFSAQPSEQLELEKGANL